MKFKGKIHDVIVPIVVVLIDIFRHLPVIASNVKCMQQENILGGIH